MQHIQKFTIEGFRALRGVAFNGCETLNLLMGANNSGKTSVLEALSLLGKLRGARRTRSERPFQGPVNAAAPRVEISALVEGAQVDLAIENIALGGAARIQLSVDGRRMQADRLEQLYRQHPLDMPVSYISPAVHYGWENERIPMFKEAWQADILELLQDFDAHIHSVYLEEAGVTFARSAQIGDAPLATVGDGLRKAFAIGCALLSVPGGLLLIDEIEAAIHPNALPVFCEWLYKMCRKHRVQAFVTTHSLDAIDAVVDAVGEEGEGLAGYRLEAEEYTRVRRFSGRRLFEMRALQGLDMR
ncbi:recombination protein F [uncultured Clostridium sp.]|nr:recombination protein F [uncultured Clostridium sp.]